MNKISKKILAPISLALLIAIICGCILWTVFSPSRMLGKTADAIQALRGPFDLVRTDPATGKIISAGYITTNWTVNVFDAGEPDEYLMIWFDEDGRAVRAEEHYYIPGG